MVCIAAFIILAIIGIFVAIISIFKPKVGKAYLKAFKKSWGCLWKKVRLQKCETGFKEDVKNTLLSRVIIKHPKWVKPLSIIIEVASVVIVVVAVWALLTAIKSLLALWALGSCNVTQPASCSFSAGMCGIDEGEPKNVIEATGRWFTEWGEIFEAIPDKFHEFKAEDYGFEYIDVNNGKDETVLDIFDPSCQYCMSSYRNQKEAGIFNDKNVRLVAVAIQDPDGAYKFKNSELMVRYILAANKYGSKYPLTIIDAIFTGKNHEGISYYTLFRDATEDDYMTSRIEGWLTSAGLSSEQLAELKKNLNSDEVNSMMAKNKEIMEKELKLKGIPTTIYDGKKHTGLWTAE